MPVAVYVRPETLRGQQQMFGEIFGEHNDELYPDAKDIEAQIFEKNSQVAKCIRRDDIKGVAVHLPRLYGWSVGLWNRENLDIAEAVWHKYPNICARCFKAEGCTCIVQRLKYNSEDPRLIPYREDRSAEPKTVRGWQTRFDMMFGAANSDKHLVDIWLHLTEELGEMGRALRHKDRAHLEEESADSFAWFIALCIKLGLDADNLIWETYSWKCDECRQRKCICQFD